MSEAQTFVRNAKVEMAPMKDETVLFNPSNNKFCVLNSTAAFVWTSLEQPHTARQLASELTRKYTGVDLERAECDVIKALEDLQGIACVVRAN